MHQHTRTPRWGNYKQARDHSGLSIRLLQDFVKDNLIRSSVVIKPGAKRGVRLIDLRSLDELIEQGIGMKVSLKMNADREEQ
jgi:hypothetical protein